MTKNPIDRRKFVLRATAGAGTLMLAGCDKLSASSWFPPVLDSAEAVTQFVQTSVTPPGSLAREFTEADLSPHFKSNGTHDPGNPEYQALAKNHFRDWRLDVGGLVEHPMRFSLADLRKLPARTQITRHDCVEGWSCIGKWRGALLSALLERVGPRPEARYVVCYAGDALAGSPDKYYGSIDLAEAHHPQTILAYDMNDQALPIPYGAPLRLRVERQLGYKMTKYIMRMELVDSFARINGGNGGYWEDRGYEWYAGI